MLSIAEQLLKFSNEHRHVDVYLDVRNYAVVVRVRWNRGNDEHGLEESAQIELALAARDTMWQGQSRELHAQLSDAALSLEKVATSLKASAARAQMMAVAETNAAISKLAQQGSATAKNSLVSYGTKPGVVGELSHRLHKPVNNPPPKPEKPATVGDLTLNKTQQRIIDALAWYESIGITEPTSLQVGAVALIDVTGGHFSNTVGPLSSGGLIERGDGVIRLTDAGRAVAKLPARLNTLEEYHEMLRSRVRKARSASGKTVEVLDAIIAGGGAELSSEEVGAAVGIDHTGGHFSNTIGPLGTLGLIERRSGKVKPTELLFPEGVF